MIQYHEKLSLAESRLFIQALSLNPGFFFLKTDSASFFSSHPFYKVSCKKGQVWGEKEGHSPHVISNDGFSCLPMLMKELSMPNLNPFFLAGAVGYIGYESARFLPDFQHIPFHETPEDFHFGFYRHGLTLFDTHGELWWYGNDDWALSTKKNLSLNKKPLNPLQPLPTLTPDMTRQAYQNAFLAVQDAITRGMTYQINLTSRWKFKSFYPSSAYWFYEQVSPEAKYGAVLSTPERLICSWSPEKFVEIQGDRIETHPMKGTFLKTGQAAIDNKGLASFKECKKNEAELTMIVDLLRHDLRKICKPGSVSVVDHQKIQAHAHVFQKTSVVSGTLNTSPIEAVISLLPGGSITGAPKISAAEIIALLEPCARDVYTGCIGYFGFNGNAHFNMAIRTAYSYENCFYYHAGSGVTADSLLHQEWEEIEWKLRPFPFEASHGF